MPNYQNGKIYTIRCRNDDTLIYVGSTTMTLSKRIAEHRYASVSNNKKKLYNKVNGNWEDWYIELYVECPCNTKEELCRKEGEVIREIATLNYEIAGRTDAEYRKDMKEVIAKKMVLAGKKYRDNNKEVLSNRFKDWYEKNKSLVLEPRKVKVCCDICGSFIRKDGLREHQKTKKCLEASKS